MRHSPLGAQIVKFSALQHRGWPLIRQASENSPGRVSGKEPEIVDHVHLIVEVQVVRDRKPRSAWARDLGVQSRLKSGDARTQLGRHSRKRAESALKLT
jgi:hypothetical protein